MIYFEHINSWFLISLFITTSSVASKQALLTLQLHFQLPAIWTYKMYEFADWWVSSTDSYSNSLGENRP